MKKLLVLLVVALVFSTVVGCFSQTAPAPVEVKLGMAVGEMFGLTNQVTKILLEDELGYVVFIREGEPIVGLTSLAEGELDIYTTFVMPNQKSFADEFVPYQVKIAGDLTDPTTGIYTGCDQGWLIPKWTRDKYNIDSLDDIAALEPGDALFNVLDVDDDGLIDLFGGAVGWLVTEINDEKINYYNENYDLDMEQVVVNYASGHEEMLTSIKSKLDAQEDILFFLWTPHYLFMEYSEALSDKDGQVQWLTDPWGFFLEPESTDYYTGFPGGTVYIAYHTGFEDEHPNVVKLLERINVTISDMNTYMYWAGVTNSGEVTVKEKNEYALQWIEDHRAEISNWLVGLEVKS